MERLKAKQIKKYLAASIRISGLTATISNTSTNVTSVVTNSLLTAGYNGQAVPLIISNSETAPGIITSTNNRCELYYTTNGNKIEYQGNEVYGRLTQSSGVYTLSYFYLLAGVETAYTIPSTTTIDFEFNYRFEFKDLPTDAIIATKQRYIQDDIASIGGRERTEKLTVSSLNSISALSVTPLAGTSIKLIINGYVLDSLSTSPAFTIVGTAVTWNSSNADWDVETTDEVFANYFIA